MKYSQILVVVGASVVAIALRFAEIPMSNFGCMAALALLCGSVIRSPYGALVPLGVRVISDVLIYFKTGYGFFSSWPFDYAAYVLIFFGVGRLVRSADAIKAVAGSFASAVIYFVVSNFGVWAATEFYPHTVAGLFECYTLGLPFASGTFVGNVLFGPVMIIAAYRFAAPVNDTAWQAYPATNED